MLIKLSITIEVDAALYKDTGEMPDSLVQDLDKLLSEMEEVCHKSKMDLSIYDQEYKEI